MKKKIFFLHIFFLIAVFCLVQKAFGEGELAAGTVLRPQVAEFTAKESKNPFRDRLGVGEKPEQGVQGAIEEKTVAEEEVKPPPLQIQGTIWDSDLPQAIINNKVFKIGDTIDGVQIVEIKKSGITILFKNKTFDMGSFLGPQEGAPRKGGKRRQKNED